MRKILDTIGSPNEFLFSNFINYSKSMISKGIDFKSIDDFDIYFDSKIPEFIPTNIFEAEFYRIAKVK